MNTREKDCLAALVHHLDGSQIIEADDLMRDIEYLAKTSSGPIVFDEDTLFDTLAEVGQRHADAGR